MADKKGFQLMGSCNCILLAADALLAPPRKNLHHFVTIWCHWQQNHSQRKQTIWHSPRLALFLFSLTQHGLYFYFHLPCCGFIFFALALLCPYFSSHACCADIPALWLLLTLQRLIFYALTLLCPYFSAHLPCCAIIFLRTYSVPCCVLRLPC